MKGAFVPVLLAVLALTASRSRLSRRKKAPPCRRRSSKSIPTGRSRCRITGCRAPPSACPSMPRITSGSSIGRRPLKTTSRPPISRSAIPAETTKHSQSLRRLSAPADADRRVLQGRAPGAGIRSGGKSGESWGGPGAGLRMAGEQPRHHGRSQRQCLDWRQRQHGHADPEVRQEGKFLLQLGNQGKHNGSNDLENFWRPAKIYEDVAANDVYIADGYGNRRVIVIDGETGKYKRHWGAYGNKPERRTVPAYNPAEPPSKQFNTVHCADRLEGRLRVCLRPRERSRAGVSQGRHVREGSLLRQEHASVRLGLGHDVFARPAADLHLHGQRRGREDLHRVCEHARSPDLASAMADGSPGSSSASITWIPIRRATSTPPKPTPARAFSASSTRAWGR